MDERRSTVQCSCGHAFETPASAEAKDVPCPVCAKPVAVRPALRKATVRRSTGETSTDVPASPIPGYTFLKRIGHGGMGEVFLARQESLQRDVAVKLLPPELAKDR
ncbi:MAG TPA: hypothetical protein VEJ18_08935, partial [Planctomycetota bacterium]|nr:hypothetical protein [Planctomycetota bacterium]